MRKFLRIVLALMTLTMVMSFQRKLEWLAAGNIVIGSLLAYIFREKSIGHFIRANVR